MDCRLVREHLDAYVDHELEPTLIIEFELHLDACSGCRNELALSRLIRQAVRAEVPAVHAPASLQLRIGKALDEVDRSAGRSTRRTAWLGALGMAAAAALALSTQWQWMVGPPKDGPAASERSGLVSEPPSQLLREIVAQHTDRLPTEIAPDRPEEVPPWFRDKVQFRVNRLEFAEPVRMEGARVSYIASRPAAKLYYRVGGSRVTVVAFPVDASATLRTALHDANAARDYKLRRTRIGNRVVTYDNVQNYTVPMVEHNGVVYAFTGDLDQRTLLHLVGSVRMP